MYKYDVSLKENIVIEIQELAEKCNLDKVILFGSRARRDNREKSDIDLAISGGNSAEFATAVDDEINTLLFFDVVDMGLPISDELTESINREGICIYEKV